MINENLYQKVLLQPAEEGATQLLIVSGYASSSMAYRHLAELKKIPGWDTTTNVHLIYGMSTTEGVSLIHDNMFHKLQREENGFRCFYRVDRPSVHSKVYIWMNGDTPIKAFVGSANYTQRGFLGVGQQMESMTEADPQEAFGFYQSILCGSMEIDHDDIDQNVVFFKSEAIRQESDYATLPLLNRQGHVNERSGLNWGQRPEENRNPNQAYLPIPSSIAKRQFFPPRTVRFTVLTDDQKSFVAVTAQDNDKAIHTPEGNHILGEYFRARLGIPLGAPITKEDLERYGRTDVEFCKLDDETYVMDFSVDS
ncbi:MAG: NgoFVII family restriction endonuclease [Gammaproteobacteria bacterium]|nr:NgoFVII family restriction endonuclease [Gammaproteobacteria bacterium]